MGWIKRNLFFVIGSVVALGLLGAAGFYDYKSWQRNAAALAHLNELYTSLQNNTIKDRNGKTISPGNDKVDNIAAARDQDRQLRQWLSQTTNYFKPIAPIPRPESGRITDQSFAAALHRTFDQLQHEADAANAALPPDFYFSFTADQDRLTFAPGSLEPLSVQLGEVKTIAEVFFAAGVNALDGIQRLRVSPDDTSGPQTDYLDDQPATTDLGMLTPYQVTFRAFSPEIARVLSGFANSPHGFIVKTISVQPSGAAAEAGAYPPAGGYPPVTPAPAGGRPGYGMGAAPAPIAGRSGLQPVLNEQLLSITLRVEVVKLTPRN